MVEAPLRQQSFVASSFDNAPTPYDQHLVRPADGA